MNIEVYDELCLLLEKQEELIQEQSNIIKLLLRESVRLGNLANISEIALDV